MLTYSFSADHLHMVKLNLLVTKVMKTNWQWILFGVDNKAETICNIIATMRSLADKSQSIAICCIECRLSITMRYISINIYKNILFRVYLYVYVTTVCYFLLISFSVQASCIKCLGVVAPW